jgi:hypothetical protein
VRRRGFFGALLALPAALRARKALPAPEPVEYRMDFMGSLSTARPSGMEAWLPATPPSDAFFGIHRSVDPRPQHVFVAPDVHAVLVEAIHRMREET